MNIEKLRINFTYKVAFYIFLIGGVIALLIEVKYRYIFWFNSTFIMFLIIMFSLVLFSIFSVMELLIRKKIDISKYFLLITLICIVGIAGGTLISNLQAEFSKGKAEKIINALELYKQDNAKYPKDLLMLTPKYLEYIPCSNMGWFDISYKYESAAELTFSIQFPAADEMVWRYNKVTGWRRVPY